MTKARKLAHSVDADGKVVMEVFVPGAEDDAVSIGLRMLTQQLLSRNLGKETGGGFGGAFGYGVDFQNDVFIMYPSYMDDVCACGYEERWRPRDEQWCAEHEHQPTCYQAELRSQMDTYDIEHRWREIEALAFGPNATPFDMLFGTHKKSAMDAWRIASAARQKFENRLYKRLCKKHKLSHFGCAIHCTCGYAELRRAWCATDSHDLMCPVVRPNFWHKPTGMKVEWYKYIGRDNRVELGSAASWRDVLEDCLHSIGCESLEIVAKEYEAAEKEAAEASRRSIEYLFSDEGQAMMRDMEAKGVIRTFIGGGEIDDVSDKPTH